MNTKSLALRSAKETFCEADDLAGAVVAEGDDDIVADLLHERPQVVEIGDVQERQVDLVAVDVEVGDGVAVEAAGVVGEDVVAGAAHQPVVTGAADEAVGAGAADEAVVAGTGGDACRCRCRRTACRGSRCR